MVSDIRDEAFMNDEEAEAAINETIEEVAQAIQAEEQGIIFTNPRKMKDLMVVYKLMKYITSGKRLKITYEINKPYKTMAFVSIVGKDLKFSHPRWFVMATKIASNVDIFPRVDGTVQIDFTFNGFANRID